MTAAHAVDLRNPFPGLRPFREDEANRFFGQDDRIEDLIYRLSRQRFLAVLGLSGSGKSSLLNAGLLAQIRPARLPDGTPRWCIARLNPGDDPLGNLAAAILPWLPKHVTARSELESDTRALARQIRANGNPRQKVLLVVDQFEELFRYQESGSAERRNQAAQFVELLLEAAGDEDNAIHVLLAMRSEYLGDCATFHGLAEEVNAATYLIPKMERESAAEVIVEPVELQGATINPLLVQHLINESEALEDGLPLLQHSLRRLWDTWVKRRAPATPIGFDDLGERSLEAHLNGHLDSIYDGLNAVQKGTAERLFRALADRDARGRVTRRPLVYGSLVWPELDAVVKAFQDEKLGRTFLVRSGSLLDISHECLLRRWNRVRRWLATEDRDREQLLLLTGAARDAGWPKPIAPLAGLTLDTLRKWREESNPDTAWAGRYGVDLAWAEGYLDWSLAEARKKTNRWRVLLIGIFLGALVAAVAMTALWLEARSATSIANTQRSNAEMAFRGLDALNAKLREQTDRANRTAELATQALKETELANQSLALETRRANRAATEARDNARTAEEQRKAATEAQASADSANQAAQAALLRAEESAAKEASSRKGAEQSLRTAQTLRAISEAQAQWNTASAQAVLSPSLAFSTVVEAVGRLFRNQGVLPREGLDRLFEVLPAALYRNSLDKVPADMAKSVTFSPDGREIIAAYEDGSSSRWNTSLSVPKGASSPVGMIADTVMLTPDGQRLLVARMSAADGSEQQAFLRRVGVSGRGHVFVYDTVTQKLLYTAQNYRHPLSVVAISADGSSMASASSFGSLYLYKLDQRTASRLWRHPRFLDFGVLIFGRRPHIVTAIALSHNDRLIAVGNQDGRIEIWRADGKRLSQMQAHQQTVTSLSFTLDDKRLITTSKDRSAKIWDLDDAMHKSITLGVQCSGCEHSDAVLASAVGGKNGLIATGGQDHTVRLWTAEGKLISTLPASTSYVTGVVFSPNEAQLATVGSEGSVRIWDLTRLPEMLALQRDLEMLRAVQTKLTSPQEPPSGTGQILERLNQLAGRQPSN
jgi:WD40 repeat protein